MIVQTPEGSIRLPECPNHQVLRKRCIQGIDRIQNEGG
jgi:hypothetical protein